MNIWYKEGFGGGGNRGCDTPNVFAPFGRSAIFSYHSVDLQFFLTIR